MIDLPAIVARLLLAVEVAVFVAFATAVLVGIFHLYRGSHR